MNSNTPSIKTSFTHSILQGSAYQVGQAEANAIKDIPGFTNFLNSGSTFSNRPPFFETIQLIREFCPGLEEEISGFCDTIKIKMEDLVYLASSHLDKVHCSHLAVLPALTQNHHTLVGRNYDFGETMDDKRLCSTFIQGKNAHIGFSTLLFGRQEGMNEHGLTITASVGGMPVGNNIAGLKPALQSGLQFWVVIRSLLEQCCTIKEALDLLKNIPHCGNPIYIIADPSGQAARVEVYGKDKNITLIDSTSSQQYLLATNHFLSDSIARLEPAKFNHSVQRAKTISSFVAQKTGILQTNDLKTLLSTQYPHGLCCHYYDEFFGTLHSMLFDLTGRKIEFTFGSPSANSWQTIDFNTRQLNSHEATLPAEKTPPDFWLPLTQQ
jgi:predicted choloylglycine hydrolase